MTIGLLPPLAEAPRVAGIRRETTSSSQERMK
jgi:hypothetical protein